jgi:hypothetical protein
MAGVVMGCFLVRGMTPPFSFFMRHKRFHRKTQLAANTHTQP